METPDETMMMSMRRVPCANLPCRIIIIGISTVIIGLGFAMFLVGCLFLWSESMIESHVAEQMENLFEYNGLSNKLHAKRILLSALLGYTSPLGRVLFWFGIFVMFICALGLYGAALRNRFILFTFASIMFAKIFVVSIMILAFHVNPNSVVGIYREMAWSAVRGYRSMVDLDADSLVVSLMMPIMKCCGMSNGEDFKGSQNFVREIIDSTGVTTISIPLPCCKLKTTYEPLFRSCPKHFDERNSNYKTGCWPIIEKNIQSAYAKVSYAAILTTICELTMASLAVYLSITLG